MPASPRGEALFRCAIKHLAFSSEGGKAPEAGGERSGCTQSERLGPAGLLAFVHLGELESVLLSRFSPV